MERKKSPSPTHLCSTLAFGRYNVYINAYLLNRDRLKTKLQQLSLFSEHNILLMPVELQKDFRFNLRLLKITDKFQILGSI